LSSFRKMPIKQHVPLTWWVIQPPLGISQLVILQSMLL
jgi:hypothetical protein